MAKLQELLGDAYHEGMTFEEADKAFDQLKIADLSSGRYVDKDKYERLNAELQTEKEAHNALVAKTKDYDALLDFKTTTEAQAKKEELKGQLKTAGFKDEYLDFALYQVESGAIKNDDKFADNVKDFLEKNVQYKAEPANPGVPPSINTGLGSNTGNDNNEPHLAKQVSDAPWMNH